MTLAFQDRRGKIVSLLVYVVAVWMVWDTVSFVFVRLEIGVPSSLSEANVGGKRLKVEWRFGMCLVLR